MFAEYETRLLHRSICSHRRPWFVSTRALFRASLRLHYPKAVMTRAGNCSFPPSPSRYRSACISLTVCDNPHCRTAGFKKPSVQPKEICAGAPLDRRRLRTRTRTSVARPSPYQTSSPRRAEFLATVSRQACDTMSHRYPGQRHAGRTDVGRAEASDVQVFPHHMVPATSTAPRVASILSSCPSAMRGIYPSGLSCPYATMDAPSAGVRQPLFGGYCSAREACRNRHI